MEAEAAPQLPAAGHPLRQEPRQVSSPPLTFEARVRHLLHVLLHQAALGAYLAAQVALHALPGCGDGGQGPLASTWA